MVTEWSFADVPNDLLKEAKKYIKYRKII